ESNNLASESLEPEVLKMELLAYNFHESFNLAPLFKHLERQIEERMVNANGHTNRIEESQEYLKRLRQVAGDIITKQLSALCEPESSQDILIGYAIPPGNP